MVRTSRSYFVKYKVVAQDIDRKEQATTFTIEDPLRQIFRMRAQELTKMPDVLYQLSPRDIHMVVYTAMSEAH